VFSTDDRQLGGEHSSLTSGHQLRNLSLQRSSTYIFLPRVLLSANSTPVLATMTASLDPRSLRPVGHVDENLLCPICTVPFIVPMQTSCRHVFCSFCINTWLDTSSECPGCRNRLTSPDPDQSDADYLQDVLSEDAQAVPLRPAPTVLIGILDSIKFYCPNKENGCDVELSRDLMESHVMAECPHTLTTCPDKNCDKLVPRQKRDSDVCGHKSVECDLCSTEMRQMDLGVSSAFIPRSMILD
jgi:hypothetical protein